MSWIVTPAGDTINLDYVAKVMYGGNFMVPQPLCVFIYHAIAEGKGATIKYTYGSNSDAYMVYLRIRNAIKRSQVVDDLRAVNPLAGTSLDVATGSHTGGTTVILTGTGFTTNTLVILGGNQASILVSDIDRIQFVTPAHAAGAVDLVLQDGPNTVTMAGAFTYT